MSSRTCPKCQRYTDLDAQSCECGQVFREDLTDRWLGGLVEFQFPQTLFAWSLIVTTVPLTVGLMGCLVLFDWFDLSTVASALGWTAFLTLPIVTQALPVFRKRNGGCTLGCFLWISVSIGLLIAAAKWSFDDPVITREVKAVARFQSDVPASLGGMMLGESRKELEERRGEGRFSVFPSCPVADSYSITWEDGAVAVFIKEKAVWLEAPSLEQNGEVLIKKGDAKARIGHLFETSSFMEKRKIYEIDGTEFLFEVLKQERIGRIIASVPGTSIRNKKTRGSVNGISLGMLKSDLGAFEQQADGYFKARGAIVRCDKYDRVVSVQGDSFKLDGEVVMEKGVFKKKFRELPRSMARQVGADFGQGVARLLVVKGQKQVHFSLLRSKKKVPRT